MRAIMAQLLPNDHAAFFYRNRGEQFAAVIPFIQIGLERNERCLYIASDNSVRMILDEMEKAGINTDREIKLGNLTVATPEETYLKHGVFEPEEMIAELTMEVKKALDDGYSAFRAAGELMWAINLPSALSRLYGYEASLDFHFPEEFIALCQYNETSFRPDIISQMLRTHAKVIARGKLLENRYYVPKARSLMGSYPEVTVDSLAMAQ